MSGIRLSEKHGVNPALGACYWCGGDDGTVVLMGRLPGDAEAPRKVVTSTEPCAKCKSVMEQGITIIEAHQGGRHDEFQLQPGVWPTGRWCVITLNASERLFKDAPQWDAIIRHRKMFMHPDTYKAMGFDKETT